MQPFLFLDLETTGYMPLQRKVLATAGTGHSSIHHVVLEPWHEIIEIGGVFAHPKNLSVIGEFERKVIPQFPERCGPDAARVNGYPERAAKGEWDNAAPLDRAIDVLFRINTRFEFSNLVGQNFFFDWSFLSVAFALCGLSEKEINAHFHYKKVDVASMAVQTLLKPDEVYDPKNFSLRSGRLQKVLGIEPEPLPHTALNGARQAYETFCALRAYADTSDRQ